MALGSIRTAWQAQTLHFSHNPEHGKKYSSLILDNRGVGKSSTPFTRYSTKIMAADVLGVLDFLGFAAPRSLHVVGISLGGMIAQELGLMIPDRIASLTLVSTAARLVNTEGFFKNLYHFILMCMPKSVDAQIAMLKGQLFSPAWLLQKDDDTNYPSGGKFPTNGDRFLAQEIAKRLNPDEGGMKGIILQGLAAKQHNVSDRQLKELGDAVGRDRITVMHATLDKMIPYAHGERLAKGLGVDLVTWEHCGHAVTTEKRCEFNAALEQIIEKTEALNNSSGSSPAATHSPLSAKGVGRGT